MSLRISFVLMVIGATLCAGCSGDKVQGVYKGTWGGSYSAQNAGVVKIIQMNGTDDVTITVARPGLQLVFLGFTLKAEKASAKRYILSQNQSFRVEIQGRPVSFHLESGDFSVDCSHLTLNIIGRTEEKPGAGQINIMFSGNGK
jgi:hypothetical protein